jgi:hypothetical protein
MSPIVFPAVPVSYETAPLEDATDGEDAVTVAVEVETVCSRSLVMCDLTTDFARDPKTDLTTDLAREWSSFPCSGCFSNIPPNSSIISPINPRRMS